jgi:hypothetical protein
MKILPEWYKNNPGKKLNGKRYCADEDTSLNKLQQAHRRGDINVYAPVKSFKEQWKTIFDKNGMYVSAYPVPNTRVSLDLPPISVQWQQAYRKKLKLEKRDV